VDEESLQSRVEYFRSVADTLRGIANRLRFDFRRADQLRSLADGFERFAARIEQEAGADKL
jgi:hypothetical protein